MASWKWLPDGKTVEVTTQSREAILFEATTVKESEWQGFYEKIADDGEVYAILRRAKTAFGIGSADYTGAAENLKELVREFSKVSRSILATAQDIDVFFKSPGLTKAFGRDTVGLVEFALEFVARVYVKGIPNGE